MTRPKPDLPRVIGHRGACGYAPENTLVSIHTAADMGVEWVELDVKLTADNVPVIFHDDTLERTTNGSGNMAETRWDDLRQLEAGSWFAESFAGIRVPTLEEAVDVLIKRDLGLNLEIKPCPGREKETAEIALDLLSRIWDDHERLLISSFSHVSLETARDMARDWARGLLLRGGGDWPENWAELAAYLEVATVNLNGNAASPGQIASVIQAGYPVLAYTVNDEDTAERLFDLGVAGVFTDEPDLFL